MLGGQFSFSSFASPACSSAGRLVPLLSSAFWHSVSAGFAFPFAFPLAFGFGFSFAAAAAAAPYMKTTKHPASKVLIAAANCK